MALTEMQMERLLGAGMELGVSIALIKTGKLKPYLKKSEAYRLYGRHKIDRWLEQGYLSPQKDGDHSSAWRLSRIDIELLMHATELQRCFW